MSFNWNKNPAAWRPSGAARKAGLVWILALGLSGCASAPAAETPARENPAPPVAVVETPAPAPESAAPESAAPETTNPAPTQTTVDPNTELLLRVQELETLLAADTPPGWQVRAEFVRNRIPYQWQGAAGDAIRVMYTRPGARAPIQVYDESTGARRTELVEPQFIRYLYLSLDAGFAEPRNHLIRPDRIAGVTRDFVVITPSSTTREADFQSAAIQPIFDRIFEVSEANTLRYAVRLPSLPAAVNPEAYPGRLAIIAAQPSSEGNYNLWVKTLQ